jgi:hypothetical protein
MGNKDLLKQYVDTGLKLSQHQVEFLTPNLMKTYIRKRIISAFESVEYRIEDYEYKIMPEELKPKFLKKLIEAIIAKKYDKYVSMLLGGLKSGTLFKWEYDELGYYLGKKKQKQYLNWRLSEISILEDWEFIELDNENKLKYIESMRKINSHIGDKYKKLMRVDESIKRYKDILDYGK